MPHYMYCYLGYFEPPFPSPGLLVITPEQSHYSSFSMQCCGLAHTCQPSRLSRDLGICVGVQGFSLFVQGFKLWGFLILVFGYMYSAIFLQFTSASIIIITPKISNRFHGRDHTKFTTCTLNLSILSLCPEC